MADNRYGDNELVELAFRSHRDEIYRYFLRRTRSYVDAEDLTQRVFADAAAALPAARPDSVLAWLYRVAQRRFVDYARARRFEVPLDDEMPRETEYGAALAAPITAAVKRLSTDQRAVVVKKLFEGKAFAEIAAELGTTEGACKMRFSRALRQLRADLAAEGLER